MKTTTLKFRRDSRAPWKFTFTDLHWTWEWILMFPTASVVGRFAIFCQPQKKSYNKIPKFFRDVVRISAILRFTQEQLEKLFDAADSDKARRLKFSAEILQLILRRCAWEVVTWKSYIAVYCSATPPCSISRLTHLYKIHFPSLCLRLPDGRLLKDKKNTHVRRATNRISNTVISQMFTYLPPQYFPKSLLSLSPLALSRQNGAIQYEELCSWLCDTPCFSKCPWACHVFPTWFGGEKGHEKNIKCWLKSNSLHFQWFCWWQDSTVWFAFLCWTFWRWKWLLATTIIFFPVASFSRCFQGTSDVESGRNGFH